MQEKKTSELDELLETMRPEQATEFFQKNSENMADEDKAFYYYMRNVLDMKSLKLKDIYSFAGVSESWGEKILRMERNTKDRDLILRFCIAGHFSLEETNRALKLYGMTPLYSRNKRDVCIILAINNREYDLAQVDELLVGQGFAQLSVDDIS
ncbi:MAG: hypothetical protein ACI4FY_08255 [Acetatifactor sp.]